MVFTETSHLWKYSTLLKLLLLVVSTFYSSLACPKKCQCLQGGIVVCQNKYLLEIPSDFPNDTVHAYIGANFIRKIRKDTFKNTKLLKTLEVSSNFLREIEPGAFEHTKDLTTLTLRDNLLPAITKDMFRGLRNLQNLDLSDASPARVALCIEDESFVDLRNLVSLKLDHNNMIGITNSTLIGLPKLEHLDLSNNNLQLISSAAFDTMKSATVTFDNTIKCCCSTVRAMKSIMGSTNGRCRKSCSDDFLNCQKLIKSSCLLAHNPRAQNSAHRLDYLKRVKPTKGIQNAEKENYKVIPKKPLASKELIRNISFDLQFQRQLSYISNMKHSGVGLTRNEQWSIAITTCLVFVVSVLMFLMAIYCKKKKFSYHMKCCSRKQCVLNNSSNNIIHEVNMMNKYFTAPSESHI